MCFAERLYQVEHPRYVKLIDEVCNVAEGESGYWISKKWYKGIDWRHYVQLDNVIWLTFFYRLAISQAQTACRLS
jgi:hypothetical protein